MSIDMGYGSTTDEVLNKLQEMKEQIDDLYEGQEAIKDLLKELAAALDLLTETEQDDWGV
jgi:chaperonin cofactor prefoldin